MSYITHWTQQTHLKMWRGGGNRGTIKFSQSTQQQQHLCETLSQKYQHSIEQFQILKRFVNSETWVYPINILWGILQHSGSEILRNKDFAELISPAPSWTHLSEYTVIYSWHPIKRHLLYSTWPRGLHYKSFCNICNRLAFEGLLIQIWALCIYHSAG